ncbi:MAG: PilN domain-containing protein [Planctomycetota bacterium]|nr:PilN domain-containing protein [Planctomycetota bacterium]
MQGVDLMPRRCREVLGRRAAMRRWFLVYALTATVIGAGHVMLSRSRSFAARERDVLAERVRLNWSRSEIAQRLVKEIEEVEGTITRYTRLSWPVRSAQVLEVLGGAASGAVTFTQVALTPREERQPARARAAGAAGGATEKAPEPRTLMVVEVEGIATDDVEVASFVSGLEASPLFGSVRLDFARSREVEGREARAFRVTGEIDLSARYTFVRAAEGVDDVEP